MRYGDTDQMGFAYYAHYLRWFEIGRAEMLRALGTSYRAVEETGTRLPVLKALKRASVQFAYRVVGEQDRELLAIDHTEHCSLGRNG